MTDTPDGTSIAPAEYNGTAVGMYVEQNQVGAAVTKKQGEFIADARLAYDGTPYRHDRRLRNDPHVQCGSETAPTTTGWVVKLNSWRNRPSSKGLGLTADGHLAAPIYVLTIAQSLAHSSCVGAQNVLHIASAFGAKRQQQ